MKLHHVIVTLLVWSFSLLSNAFVPPLAAVFKTCFEGRKSQPTETVFRHQVVLRSGEVLNIEERLAEMGGKTYALFRNPTFGEAGATWARGLYTFSGDKKIGSKSQSFVGFFTLQSADRFRDLLLDERFIKREQFEQYKSGFTPQGDPSTWDLKENYVIQPQVYFSKTPAGFSIVAVGTEDAKSRKAVFFEKERMVLSRLEWREGNQVVAWNFQTFRKVAGDGVLPYEMNFKSEDKEWVKSTLVNRQYLNGKLKSQWLERFSSASKTTPTPQLEEALRTLLSYR